MLMDSYIISILYKLIIFSLPLNPAINRIDNAAIFYALDVKNKKSFNPNLYFIASCPKFL